jgi:uncharacterized protein (TIGR02118 family)
MYQITVTYGVPADPESFDRYYRDTHLPLASQIPNLQSLTGGRCYSADGQPIGAYLVTTLTFDSEEVAVSSMASPEGIAAAQDIANFATGGASIVYTDVRYQLP